MTFRLNVCLALGILALLHQDVQCHVQSLLSFTKASASEDVEFCTMPDVNDEYLLLKSANVQMNASPALKLWSGEMSLRNPDSGDVYPLKVALKGGQYTDSGLSVTGELLLKDGDAQFAVAEFHLYADGFDSFCPVFATPLKPGQLDPARSKLLTSLPARSSYDATWVLIQQSADMRDTGLALVDHAAYHQKHAAVNHYKLYMSHSVEQLLSLDGIQELISSGVLELVLWDCWPIHHGTPKSEKHLDKLHMNIQTQNHMIMYGVLSSWLSATYVVLGDIDEFWTTATPMTIPQVMEIVAPKGTLVSVLSLDCMQAICVACMESHPKKDIDAWRDANVTKGRNPIELYSFSKDKVLIYKDIVDPNLAGFVKVHHSEPLDGEFVALRDSTIASLRHGRNLFYHRGSK